MVQEKYGNPDRRGEILDFRGAWSEIEHSGKRGGGGG